MLRMLYLFLRLNPPRMELPLMDENGAPYRERFLTPSLFVIFGIYAVCGLLPFLSA